MTSIQEIAEKIKCSIAENRPNLRAIPDDLFLGLIIILVAFGSFGLGRLSKIEGAKTPIRIEDAPQVTADAFSKESKGTIGSSVILPEKNNESSQLVGSKNGSKYYYPWCSVAQKITEANRIYFTSKSEAEARGYTPSSTCKGL